MNDVLKQIENSKEPIFWTVVAIVLLLLIFKLVSTIIDRRRIKSVTSLKRGTKSERTFILSLLKHGIPPITIFHDLYVKKNNDKFSQIDVVLVTTEGIIVFEVKDFSGWIFGNGNNAQWTKVLAYGKRKYRFYNPIKQNANHIKALKSQLKQFDKIPFYSIIVFYGECELKEINYVPVGTYLTKPKRVFEILSQIKYNNLPAPYTNKREVITALQQAVNAGSILENQQKHVDNINDMLGKHRIFE